jgi:Rieske Fe-S protein
MHLGCPVRAFAGSFGCPCHGGQYDSEGRRTAGPPVRPLNRYRTKIVNGSLILGQLMATESVDKNGQAKLVQLKGPGQPVDGILSFLYPDAPQ